MSDIDLPREDPVVARLACAFTGAVMHETAARLIRAAYSCVYIKSRVSDVP